MMMSARYNVGSHDTPKPLPSLSAVNIYRIIFTHDNSATSRANYNNNNNNYNNNNEQRDAAKSHD